MIRCQLCWTCRRLPYEKYSDGLFVYFCTIVRACISRVLKTSGLNFSAVGLNRLSAVWSTYPSFHLPRIQILSRINRTTLPLNSFRPILHALKIWSSTTVFGETLTVPFWFPKPLQTIIFFCESSPILVRAAIVVMLKRKNYPPGLLLVYDVVRYTVISTSLYPLSIDSRRREDTPPVWTGSSWRKTERPLTVRLY